MSLADIQRHLESNEFDFSELQRQLQSKLERDKEEEVRALRIKFEKTRESEKKENERIANMQKEIDEAKQKEFQKRLEKKQIADALENYNKKRLRELEQSKKKQIEEIEKSKFLLAKQEEQVMQEIWQLEESLNRRDQEKQ